MRARLGWAAMHLLVNPTQNYAWGSHTALADLLGQPSPSPDPQAELWLGAHPSAPSMLVSDRGRSSLLEEVERAPRDLLGPEVHGAFGPRLPFLLKVIAVAAPLSLQAHPDLDQARAGFAAEQAAGVPMDSPTRCYRDDNHKPELVCALTPFEALCGLRPVEDLVELLAELSAPELTEAAEVLAGSGAPEGTRALLTAILAAPAPAPLVEAVLAGCRTHSGGGSRFAPAYREALGLAQQYPGDAGVVVSLLLNRVHLRPGEAMYVPPGRLHAYLSGLAVEVMACSDNVLRGGLTPKHVDVEELLSVAELGSSEPDTVAPAGDPGDWAGYAVPVPDFALARAEPAGTPLPSRPGGPQILLCTQGELRLGDGSSTLDLTRGGSAFVPAGPGIEITGTGILFRATTGPPCLT